jgi:hypothetical protein
MRREGRPDTEISFGDQSDVVNKSKARVKERRANDHVKKRPRRQRAGSQYGHRSLPSRIYATGNSGDSRKENS